MRMRNRKLIQNAVATILIDVSKEHRIPKHWPLPEHTIELSDFLIALDFEWELDLIVDLTKSVLDKTTETLANAHDVATKVKVAVPDDTTIKALNKGLKKISDILKSEQQFRVAYNLAINVSKIAERVG